MTEERANAITIKLFATLQLKVGIREIVYDGPVLTVGEMIDWLQRRVAEQGRDVDVIRELLEDDGRIRPGTILLVDGRNVHHVQGLNTPVDGSVLSVFPPAGGG